MRPQTVDAGPTAGPVSGRVLPTMSDAVPGRVWFRWWWLCLGTLALASAPLPAAAGDIDVHAERHGDLVVIDVHAFAPVAVGVAWSVLTDYDNMPRFLSAVKTSSVVRRSDTVWDVAQTGEARFGLFTFSASSVRELELQPLHEIRGRLLSGDFKSFQFTTDLSATGTGTAIVYHGEYEPKAWVPPFIGASVIESQTREQYQQLLSEMTRRQLPGPSIAASAADMKKGSGKP